MTPLAPAAALPAGVVHYHSTPRFTEDTIPAALLGDHDTKEGVWGLIRVMRGHLRYHVTDERRISSSFDLHEGLDGIVEPTIRHRVEPVGPVEFQVEFYRAIRAHPA